jgi:hypothetical protein
LGCSRRGALLTCAGRTRWVSAAPRGGGPRARYDPVSLPDPRVRETITGPSGRSRCFLNFLWSTTRTSTSERRRSPASPESLFSFQNVKVQETLQMSAWRGLGTTGRGLGLVEDTKRFARKRTNRFLVTKRWTRNHVHRFLVTRRFGRKRPNRYLATKSSQSQQKVAQRLVPKLAKRKKRYRCQPRRDAAWAWLRTQNGGDEIVSTVFRRTESHPYYGKMTGVCRVRLFRSLSGDKTVDTKSCPPFSGDKTVNTKSDPPFSGDTTVRTKTCEPLRLPTVTVAPWSPWP